MDSLVSVIITTYKGFDTIERALDSVLGQTYSNVEVLVVDDNGAGTFHQLETERVVQKIDDSRIRYLKHDVNKNGAAARNTGITAALGQYICFLDDDDIYLPKRIEKSLHFLLNNPDVKAVCVAVEVHYSNDKIQIVSMNRPITAERILMDEMCVGTGSNIFLSREIFDNGLRFDEAFTRHQDLEFLLALLREHSIGLLDEVLVVKKSNSTSNVPDYLKFRFAKEKYFSKFQKEISALTESDRTLLFKTHYRLLLESAYQEGDRKNIINAYKDYLKYDNLGIGDYISFVIGRSTYKTLLGKLIKS